MSGHLFDKYGAILAEDVEVLERCLAALSWHPDVLPVRVLEIGMHDGGTARGIENFLRERGFPLKYFGIDPDDGKTRPRYVPQGGEVIVGDSAEEFYRVPGDLDLVWVDGCHCRNHVVLDTVNFAPKVRIGGFLLFHDVNPRGQGQGRQYHGPEIHEFGIVVNEALEAIRFPWPGWTLFAEGIPPELDRLDCGTRAYRRDA